MACAMNKALDIIPNFLDYWDATQPAFALIWGNHMQIRFEYSRHKTEERAERALEDYFATGEVSLGDAPRIERRNTPSGIRWVVTLDG